MRATLGTTGEIDGVGLAYVARQVKGKIPRQKVNFNDKTKENVFKDDWIVNPIIVFFANGTCTVMDRNRAQRLGYLNQPDVMNIAQVNDAHTPAGRYKFAIRERDRLDAWLQLENAVILKCIAKCGHPLPLDVTYSNDSLYFMNEEVAA